MPQPQPESPAPDELFRVGAPEADAQRIVAAIQARVADRMRRGEYATLAIARAERTNLAHLRHADEFLEFYLDCLRETCFVDINDFEISERRTRWKRPLIALKRTIWNLLKFYTYRLWSQQNQVNGMLLSTVELTDERYREKIRQLEQRIEVLEQRLASAPGR
jgi:hypothetical protein